MLEKRLKKLKVVVSMIILSLIINFKAISASFRLNKRGYIAYFIIETLCEMTFREL